jgi:propanediol dehydratase small subunit
MKMFCNRNLVVQVCSRKNSLMKRTHNMAKGTAKKAHVIKEPVPKKKKTTHEYATQQLTRIFWQNVLNMHVVGNEKVSSEFLEAEWSISKDGDLDSIEKEKVEELREDLVSNLYVKLGEDYYQNRVIWANMVEHS